MRLACDYVVLPIALPLGKCKQKVPEEIPQRGGANGEHLAEVKVPFQFAVE